MSLAQDGSDLRTVSFIEFDSRSEDRLNDSGEIAYTLGFTDGGSAVFVRRGEPSCPGDINCDGVVNVFDIVKVIHAFGPCESPSHCPEDLDGSGVVDVQDLLVVIHNFGSCD